MPQLQLVFDYAQDVKLALLRHWRRGAAFAAAVVLLTLVGLLLMPRHYVSDAKLFVRFGRNLVLDPSASATAGQMVSIYETRENELNSLLEVLRSRSLLEHVVDAIGVDAILSGRLPKDLPPLEAVAMRRGDYSALPAIASDATREGRHQQAVRKLEQNIGISVPKKSSTIAISAQAETPELAQRITATLVALYMDEHLRVYHTPGSFEFFRDQSQLLQQQWRDASTRLKEAKDKYGIVTLEGKRKLLQDQIADVSTRLLAGESELATSQARITSLTASLAELPERMVAESVEGARLELIKFEAQEQQLLARFADAHPQVVAIRGKIDDLMSSIDRKAVAPNRESLARSASKQTLEMTLLTEQTTADALDKRNGVLRQQRDQLKRELADLNQQEIVVSQLQREVELAESRLKSYADKTEQARINEQLDQERITNLSIVQPASFVNKSTGPRRLYVLGLGMLVGLFGGVGLAVLCYYADPLLRTRGDLESQLGLPVTGTVPNHDSPLEVAV